MRSRTVSSLIICISLLAAISVTASTTTMASASDGGEQSTQSDNSAAANVQGSQAKGMVANEPSKKADAGTVRVNNLANLEALLNIIANGFEILGVAIGALLCLPVPVGLVFVFMKGKRLIGAGMIITGPLIVTAALATPDLINRMFTSARNAGLFN